MNPNEETVYGGMQVENEENPQVTNKKEGGKEVSWKVIGLGAATGILMGAGALFANNAMAAENPEVPTPDQPDPATEGNAGEGVATEQIAPVTSPTPVAKPAYGTSFETAFAEARAQVGPGGVFHWRGGIYSTYTKEEWDAMSDADKHAFAAKIHPEHTVDHIKVVHVTDKDPEIHIDKLEIHEHNTLVYNESQSEETTPEPAKDEDVHVIGYVGTDELTLNGKDISIENYTVDGHKAAVVNYHDENEHDIAWVDKNDNLNVDNGEAKDIVTDELLDQNLHPLSENDNLMADSGAGVDIDPSVGV
jgi:hypothetical protein